jgi:adenylate cyclase
VTGTRSLPRSSHNGGMTALQGDPLKYDLEGVYRLVGIEPPSLQRAEVEALTGVDSERSVRWWRAMGIPEVMPGEIAFGTEDVEIVRRLDTMIAAGTMSDDDVARLARLMGASFSRLVEAELAAIPALLATVAAGQTDRSEAGDDAIGFLENTMNYVWRRHLLAALAQSLSMGEDDGLRAVGFADLSGFSLISKKASAEEITEIIETFETTAFDVVSAHEGRVVKLVGDEVMFVTERLDDAVEISLDLISRLRPVEALPPVHCGVATGPTVLVGGDVFGQTVNLASRLTDQARPNSVVVTRRDGKHLLDRDDLDVRAPHRSYDLKGVGRMHILAIRPVGSDPEVQIDLEGRHAERQAR